MLPYMDSTRDENRNLLCRLLSHKGIKSLRIAKVIGFMTVLYGKPIGFVSSNLTNLPESIEVRHNYILTKYISSKE